MLKVITNLYVILSIEEFPANQLRLVVYPISNCRILAPSQVVGKGISSINRIPFYAIDFLSPRSAVIRPQPAPPTVGWLLVVAPASKVAWHLGWLDIKKCLGYPNIPSVCGNKTHNLAGNWVKKMVGNKKGDANWWINYEVWGYRWFLKATGYRQDFCLLRSYTPW